MMEAMKSKLNSGLQKFINEVIEQKEDLKRAHI